MTQLTPPTEPLEIDQTVADKLRQWTAEGRGFKLWENHEIGSSHARHVWTPARDTDGNNYCQPDWRYREATQIPPLIECRESSPLVTFSGRLKRFYWGIGLLPATEAKAKRLAEKHGGEFRWEFSGYGLATVEIVTVERMPFEAGVIKMVTELGAAETLPEFVATLPSEEA